MKRYSLYAAPLALALATSVPVAQAEQSPIFGSAQVTTLSNADAQNVTARGYYANLYGSYGIDYAYYSYLYGYYGRYYSAANSSTEQAYYYYASNYASYASQYFYYAYYYSYYGY